MDDLKEFVAESREAAIEQAARHFGVSPGELEIREISPETPGLGGRAMVLASVKGAASESRPQERFGRDRGGPGPRSRTPRREGSRERSRPPERASRERESREREPRERESREREPREREPREREPREREPRPEPRELPHLSPTGNFVAGVLQRMGFGTKVEFSEEEKDGQIVISARGEEVTDLLRRDPRIGAALTHLAGRAAKRHTEADTRVRVDLDGAGEELDLEPGEERLLAHVRELAERVRETGEIAETDPMSSRERWLVHNSLREVEGVTSESTGEGSEKRVKIVPE
jgi:predicted RNA-binding protein Jag